MNTYTQKQLSDILSKHRKWRNDEAGGQLAVLFCANLTEAKRVASGKCGFTTLSPFPRRLSRF